MPEVTWHYLENQIESVTAGNRKLMNAILLDHHAKLTAAALSDARLAPLVTFLAPVFADWGEKYGAWKNAQAGYRSASQALENFLAILREQPPGGGRSKLDEWVSKIAAFWPEGHPHYDFLLPRGREPFTRGSRDEMIGEVGRLAERLGEKATELGALAAAPGNTPAQTAEFTEQSNAMDAVQDKVLSFHGQLEGARTVQTQKEGALDQLSAQVRPARLAAADALYHDLAALMAIFYRAEDRDQVTGFFDLALIMTPPAPSDDQPDPAVPPPTP